MTLLRRLIVCLDVAEGRVVKGVQFQALRDVGDPATLAAAYEAEGADEIVLLDITASAEQRATRWDTVRRTAEQLFIPLTVGGGIRSLPDMSTALRSGADKVAVNSAALDRPELLTQAAEWFGAQCVVASIDARRGPGAPSGWCVVTHGGRQATTRDAVTWAIECVDRGAGEILLTSIDCDGTRSGYDIALTQAIAASVQVPVIASGGAGNVEHVCAVLETGEADAALVAGILHDGLATIGQVKQAMASRGLSVRMNHSASSVQQVTR